MYFFHRPLTSSGSCRIFPFLSCTAIPLPVFDLLVIFLTFSYTLSYLPILCNSSNSLHWLSHHCSLAFSVVLLSLLFSLLYSCLALSVFRCFHFLLSSMSCIISSVTQGL